MMYLSHLSLSNFRNYAQLDLALGPGLFLFYGDNAQGKTNLLEAVSMLATASSFHAAGDREVVSWSAPEHIAHLSGTVKRRDDTVEIEIAVFDPAPPVIAADSEPGAGGARGIDLPASTPRKRLKLNGVPRRTVEIIGQMKVVLFAPTDLHLVEGAPDERRRFLDRALCQVQPHYCQALIKYRKVVLQRSALLKRIRDNQEDPRMLEYLDEQLTMLAGHIMYERMRMVSALNEEAGVFQQAISGGQERLQIVYRPSFKVDAAWSTVEASEHYREQLREVRRREIIQGVCLRGPHRDDLEFLVNGVNMLTYGSRGQQRTTALSAKLAELAYMRASTGDEPVLLLDDVFSELDHLRREYLLRQVHQHEQVLLTATELAGFPADILRQAHVYHIVDGCINA
ncbi:MAG TPA: DNA replication/repair protein RecF [Ktedonobacteraceae bacterium]|jgi:DNA replication and repair protein RecF|nr:DNA replication/repair protein RecF [Ktedonobacteraceae bacterium]